MRREEADLLAQWVGQLGLPPSTVCLNIGSSTREFREQKQPHVADLFVRPLERQGIRFIHCDMKAADGVDEVGDILDPSFRKQLQRHEAKLLVCSNLLEHLTDPQAFADACAELVDAGGYALFSVPLAYPYHPDPIDTMLRLTPNQLAAMLPGWKVVRSAAIGAGNYWRDLKEIGAPFTRLLRQSVRALLPFYRPAQWRANTSLLAWLFRTYRVSAVLLQKQLG